MHARFFDHAGSPKCLRWRSWTYCLPLHRQRRHPESVFYRGSMAGLHVPLPTLRRHPHGCLRTARGRCGSLLLHRGGLAPPTPCRSPGAPVCKLGNCLKSAHLERTFSLRRSVIAENGRKSTEIYRLPPVVRVFTQPGPVTVVRGASLCRSPCRFRDEQQTAWRTGSRRIRSIGDVGGLLSPERPRLYRGLGDTPYLLPTILAPRRGSPS